MPTTRLVAGFLNMLVYPYFSALIDLHELLQATQAGRDLLALGADAAAPIGEGDFADIDVAARIHREPVRRDELPRIESGMRMPEPAQQLTVVAVDADPRPAIRQIDVDRHVGPDLADIKSAVLARLHVQPRRPVHVDPLRFVFAVAVEHLHPMIFPVGDVDPAIGVTADVVRDIELAGIGAGLAPGEQELAVRAEFMDPRIAVAVRDVEIALRREGGMGAAVERLA